MTRSIYILAALFGAVALTFSAIAVHADEADSAPAESESTTTDLPPSLTPRDVRQLREGRGMGMARVAGVNGYPGPMHVLRQAEALELSEEQVAESEALRSRVHERSREIGERIIEAEARLNALFEAGSVDRGAMREVLGEIADLRADLRAVHLEAHLDQAAVLTEQQLEKMGEMGGGERRRRREHRREHHEGKATGGES
ncbi:MAG: Spy/CpxP family protein refolding chaperone [Candidatus Wenzhouxiangella sp. M2_3B_020]